MKTTLSEFGKVLRKIRIDHDIGLKYLADLLNISPAFLSGVETGRKAVNPYLINCICEVLNLTNEESSLLDVGASKTLRNVTIQTRNEKDAEVVIMLARLIQKEELDFEKLKDSLGNI